MLRERQVRDWLQERDWLVVHTRPGTNFCDLVALKDGTIRLIEVKSTERGPYAGFPPADRQRLLDVAKMAGGQAELAWWPPRGKLRFIGSSEWPRVPGASQLQPGEPWPEEMY